LVARNRVEKWKIEIEESTPVEMVEPGDGHPPGLARSAVSSGKNYLRQMPLSLEAPERGDENLPAPHRAVWTEPGPVDGDPHDGLSPVLGEDEAMCAWLCWTPMAGRPDSSMAHLVER
jgi:hypothetical protein